MTTKGKREIQHQSYCQHQLSMYSFNLHVLSELLFLLYILKSVVAMVQRKLFHLYFIISYKSSPPAEPPKRPAYQLRSAEAFSQDPPRSDLISRGMYYLISQNNLQRRHMYHVQSQNRVLQYSRTLQSNDELDEMPIRHHNLQERPSSTKKRNSPPHQEDSDGFD